MEEKKTTASVKDVLAHFADAKIQKSLIDVYGEDIVDRFNDNINTVQEHNFIVGYGSILSLKDAKRTMPNLISHKLAYIHGYQRVFNFGKTYKGSWLNVREKVDERGMPVALVELNAEDMSNFYLREILYDSITVNAYTDNSYATEGNMAVMVLVTDKKNLNAAIEPMLTYLSLCMQGLKQLGDDRDMEHFLRYTRTANNLNLGSWLHNLDIKQYLLSHTHTSR